MCVLDAMQRMYLFTMLNDVCKLLSISLHLNATWEMGDTQGPTCGVQCQRMQKKEKLFVVLCYLSSCSLAINF